MCDYIGCNFFSKVLFYPQLCSPPHEINMASSIILILEIKQWQSWDDIDLPQSMFWLLIEQEVVLSAWAVILCTHCVAGSLLLGCFWKNCKVFFLCVFCKLFTSFPIPAFIKEYPNELCISIWFKKGKSENFHLSCILTWKHTTFYMVFFSPKIVWERMI